MSGVLCRRKNFLFSSICRGKIYSPAPSPHSLSLAPPSPARALCHLSQKYFFDILNRHKNFSLAELGVRWSLWDEKCLRVLGPCSYLEVWGKSSFQVLQEKCSQAPVAACRRNKYSQFTPHAARRRRAAMRNVWHWSLSLCFTVLLFFISLSSCVVCYAGQYPWLGSIHGWVGWVSMESFPLINSHQYSFITCVALPPCGFTYLLACSFGISNI